MALPAAGRVAKWIAAQVFNAVLNSDASAEDREDDTVFLQCGRTVFDNVPANLRTELWLSQLHSGSGLGAAAAATYVLMLEEGALDPDVQSEIDKDTHRTFPGHHRVGTPAGQRAMLNVLTAYARLDPEIGYCQGMNFLVGLLLAFLPREADAYGALVLLMQGRGLRELYKPNMSLLQVRLWQLGKLLPPRLAEHLEMHCVLPVLYASSWFLTCFASDFPIAFAARVLDVVIVDCYAAPMMKVAVGILEHCGELLLEMNDMEMILQHLKQDVPKWPKPVLQDLLTTALSKPWTSQQLALLSEMNGAETVGEAVSRVNTLNCSRGQGSGDGSVLAAEAAAAAMAGAAARRGSEGAGSDRMSSVSAAEELAPSTSTARTLSQFSSAPTLGALASFTTAGGASRMNSFFSVGAAQRWPAGTGGSISPPASPPRRASPPRAPAAAASAAPAAASFAVATSSSSAGAGSQPSRGPSAGAPSINPLPPPPASPRDVVSWEGWTPTATSLNTVSPEQLRIETDLRDVDLDPALTQALSSFHPSSSEGTPCAPSLSLWESQAAAVLSAFSAAAEGQADGSRASSATSARQCRDSSALEHTLSLGLWGAPSCSTNSRLASMPSPFESSPSWISGGSSASGLPSPVQPLHSTASSGPGVGAGAPGGASDLAFEDCYGSFQKAATRLPSMRPVQQKSAAGAAAAKVGVPAEYQGISSMAAGAAAAASVGAAAKPPLLYRSPSEELLHASGLSQLLGMLSIGSSSHPNHGNAGRGPQQKQQQQGQLMKKEAPGAGKSGEQPGPSSAAASRVAAAQAADAELDYWSSWRSGDSHPSPQQPLASLPITVPAAAASPTPLVEQQQQQLAQQQSPQLLGRTVSQPAASLTGAASGGISRSPQRSASEQQEHAARAQLVQLDGFLQAAAATTPQKAPSLLAMKRASLDSPSKPPVNGQA